ncbi:hypothetical protein IWQ61_002789 [Dispira simplex]|nr:hypothetical protein IWQ61_002789 [Dispira simplex]
MLTTTATSSPTKYDAVQLQSLDDQLDQAFDRLEVLPHLTMEDAGDTIAYMGRTTEILGLSESQLTRIFTILTRTNTHPSLAQRLIQLAYPRSTVPLALVTTVLGFVASSTRYGLCTQLLKWLAKAKDAVEDVEGLQVYYGVLLHYLSYETYRPYVTRLLCFLTTRRSVKPYRVRRVVALLTQLGTEPHLVELLRVYRLYCPTLVPSQWANSAQSGRLKPLGLRWQATVLRIHSRWQPQANNSLVPGIEPGSSTYLKYLLKVRHGTPLPAVSHFTLGHVYPRPTEIHTHQTRYVLDAITNFTEFCRVIDRIELPDQLVSVLDNRFFHHLVAYTSDPNLMLRLDGWLDQYLGDLMMKLGQRADRTVELQLVLEQVWALTRIVHRLLPAVENFLASFIRVWDGQMCAGVMFKLISYKTISPFETIYVWFLKPLHQLFKVSTATWKCRLLRCYQALFCTWLRTNKGSPLLRTQTWYNPLAGLDREATLNELIRHIDMLCLSALYAHPTNTAVQHVVLDHYELLSTLPETHRVRTLPIPSYRALHMLFFSGNPATVSRVADIIANYRLLFERIQQDPFLGDDSLEVATGLSMQDLTRFNHLLFDMCQCMWTQNAFSPSLDNLNASREAFDLPTNFVSQLRTWFADQGYDIRPSVSVLNGQGFYLFLCDFFPQHYDAQAPLLTTVPYPPVAPPFRFLTNQIFKEARMAKHQGRGSSETFSQFRTKFLEYLRNQGFRGLYKYLYVTIPSLAKQSR